MTYGRVLCVIHTRVLDGAVVSHTAELVRGNSPCHVKAPSSALRAPSPQGILLRNGEFVE
jgi:hypothetical protein